ncbi:MAG: hypothetical protein GQ564_10465 [Bacteroidales bacterium]|nr:hypothetical protein [Bacteroidales bacterium]
MAVPEVGIFVVCIVKSGKNIIETWQQDKDIENIIFIINNNEILFKVEQIKLEGRLAEKNTGSLILSTAKNNILDIWSHFRNEIKQDLTIEQVDNLIGKLKTDIFNELKTMIRLNGELPTETLKDYYNKYDNTNLIQT